MRADKLRLLAFLKHEHLVFDTVEWRSIARIDKVVRTGKHERRHGGEIKGKIAPDEPCALLVGRVALETILGDAVRRHAALRHVAAPFVNRAGLRHLNDFSVDLKCRRTRESVVKSERAWNKLWQGHLRLAARRIRILVLKNCDRMRSVVLVNAGGRETRMDWIEGVERTRTRSARERQFFLLSWRKREGALWPRHIPVVVHPYFQLSGDWLARRVLNRHWKCTRSASMDLGDAQGPEELVFASAVDLLRERPDLDLHAAALVYRRQVCNRR